MVYTPSNLGLSNKDYTQQIKTYFDGQAKLQKQNFIFQGIGTLLGIGGLFLLSKLSGSQGGGNVGGGNNNSIFTTAQERTQTSATTPQTQTSSTHAPQSTTSPSSSVSSTNGADGTNIPTNTPFNAASASADITSTGAELNNLENMLNFTAQKTEAKNFITNNATLNKNYNDALNGLNTANKALTDFQAQLKQDTPEINQLQASVSAGESAGGTEVKEFPNNQPCKGSDASCPSPSDCGIGDKPELIDGDVESRQAVDVYNRALEKYNNAKAKYEQLHTAYLKGEKDKQILESKYKDKYGDKYNGETKIAEYKSNIATAQQKVDETGSKTITIGNTTKTVKEAYEQFLQADQNEKRFDGKADLTSAQTAITKAKKYNNDMNSTLTQIGQCDTEIQALEDKIKSRGKEMKDGRFEKMQNNDKKFAGLGKRGATKYYNRVDNENDRKAIIQIQGQKAQLIGTLDGIKSQRDAEIKIVTDFINNNQPPTS